MLLLYRKHIKVLVAKFHYLRYLGDCKLFSILVQKPFSGFEFLFNLLFVENQTFTPTLTGFRSEIYEGVSKSFQTESIKKYMLTTISTH